jgi:hypothetical protein
MNLSFLLTSLQVVARPVLALAESSSLSSIGPWTPPEWSWGALTSITVPATEQVAGSVTDVTGSSPTIYVFDAVLKADHHRELRHTEHPVQTSASSPVGSISDHAYGLPARVVLEIAMSDAMASFSGLAWSGASTKSVSAFQTLVSLQASRALVTLTTRLDTYPNMIVSSILPSDTHKTLHGLRATVVFEEIFLADATAVSSSLITSTDDTSNPLSTDPQTTASSPQGTVQPTPVPATVTAQNSVTPSATVPGAGGFSSVNSGLLGNL